MVKNGYANIVIKSLVVVLQESKHTLVAKEAALGDAPIIVLIKKIITI
jgi:hypothetical protein